MLYKMLSGAALYGLIGQPGAGRNPVHEKSEADSNLPIRILNKKAEIV